MSGQEARSAATPSRGSMKPGPSDDYLALLRGEITSEEYVRRLKARVDYALGAERRVRRISRWGRWLRG